MEVAPSASSSSSVASSGPSLESPPVAMREEVQRHLCSLLQRSLQSVSSSASAGEMFAILLEGLARPPPLTTLRVDSLRYSREDAATALQETLRKQYSSQHLPPPPILPHPTLPDVLVIPNLGPRTDVRPQGKQIVVGLHCGMAVLRGADVFAPGVMGAPRDLCRGDGVSVYADLDGKCNRGLVVEYEGRILFVGNGTARMSRRELFNASAVSSGVAVHMTDALYVAPSLSSEVIDAVFPQNLPSILVSHVLDPQPGNTVLDMCAAPGGKTLHVGTLMNNQGCVIALDKTAPKVAKLKQNVDKFGLSCVHCFVFDATKALQSDGCGTVLDAAAPSPPPYPPRSFDQVLLDAPCSALGQRPQCVSHTRLKELLSYLPYQRKLIQQAVGLLKPGGTLVYSTCTYSPEENECQVEWIIKSFPQLQLVEQVPQLGFPGLPGYGLSEAQVKKLQRFGPVEFCKQLYTTMDLPNLALTQCENSHLHHTPSGKLDYPLLNNAVLLDTIGFFIAKFVNLTSYDL